MTKIFVIEDEKPLLEEIVATLRFEDYDVIGADNGVDGLTLIRESMPDLVLCDIMMPGLNGYEVLNELRADPTTATIPFIFLTAKAEKNDLRQGMELGADDYLTKPFTNSQLMSSIQTRLQKRASWESHTEQQLHILREQILLSLPHELRTPLTSILGYSEMLVDEPNIPSEEVPQIGYAIYRSALRLHHLIENYLVYIQIHFISQNPIWLERLQASCSDNPDTIIDEQARRAAQRNDRQTDLQLNISGGSNVHISAEYLYKIVDELVDNAFKFSRPGTPVYVTAAPCGDCYRLEIRDRGRGMTSEQIASIGAYKQFERRLYEQQGIGFGLIIAKRLVELHGGQFELNSRPLEGTIVRIILP